MSIILRFSGGEFDSFEIKCEIDTILAYRMLFALVFLSLDSLCYEISCDYKIIFFINLMTFGEECILK